MYFFTDPPTDDTSTVGEVIGPPVHPFHGPLAQYLRLRLHASVDDPAWAGQTQYLNFGDITSTNWPTAMTTSASKGNTTDHCFDVDDDHRSCWNGHKTVFYSSHPGVASGHAPSESDPNHVFIQLWMYMPDSWSMILGEWHNGGRIHEGECEMLQLCVRKRDPSDAEDKSKWLRPFAATASQHYYGQTLRWKPEDGSQQDLAAQTHVYHADNGNRIKAYIARNAHATYFRSGQIDMITAGECGTQIQYSPPDGFRDVISSPLGLGDYDLVALHNTTNNDGIYDWQGRWGDGMDGFESPTGPEYRIWHSETGGDFSAEASPGRFHDECRKIIGGSPDPETELKYVP